MESGGSGDTGQAASAVKGPAIGLIVVTILSMLFWVYGLVDVLRSRDVAPEDIAAQVKAQNPNLNEQQAEFATKVAGYAKQGGVLVPVIFLVFDIVILFGAIQMIRLQSYGLAMISSILALVPCISPCCVLGIPFGIWSLIVLMKADVKQAFH